MLLAKAYEMFGSFKTGGVVSDENNLVPDWLITLLNLYRVYVVTDQYKRGVSIDDNVYTWHLCDSSGLTGDNCRAIFHIPSIVVLPDKKLCCNYVGSKMGKAAWAITTNIGTYNNQQNHRIMKSGGGGLINATYVPGPTSWEVDDNGVKTCATFAFFADPLKCNGYNQFKDPYPLGDGHILMAFDLFQKGTLSTLIRIPAERVANAAEDISVKKTA